VAHPFGLARVVDAGMSRQQSNFTIHH